MPSKKYNLVHSPGDDLDSRIPLVPDEAFQHGIPFNVKFIGAMDIPRPMSRVEIVAAMRRVRFEFKAKGIKKRKVTLTVSTEGIRTCVRKKNKLRKKQHGNGQHNNIPDIIIESHPVYRIFYVSHDSQDVKIFSYIARETSSSVFHCVVFKASKKSQAMRIVRTVGQAFEVCHKISGPFESSDHENQDAASTLKDQRQDNAPNESTKSKKIFEPKTGNSPQKKIPPPINVINQMDEFDKEEVTMESPVNHPPSTPILKDYSNSNSNVANSHEIKLLREKFEQSTQATNAALAQISLLRDQLAAESNARIEAQARTHQLLQHNKELLDHLQSLVHHIQELEGNTNGKQSTSNCSISPAPLPQVMTTSFQEIDSLRRQNAALLDTILYENNRLSYPHYFVYPPPPPQTPHLYNNLLINNPHIPPHTYTPQTSSNSSSPNKYYDDFGSIFNRPSPSVAAAAAAAAALDGCSIIKPIDSNSSNRFIFEQQQLQQQQHEQQQQQLQHNLRKPCSSHSGLNNNNGVQRSVSEKINHRSELMSQVQRSVWARHTTK